MRGAEDGLILELHGDRLSVAPPISGGQAASITLTASLRRLVAALGKAAPGHVTFGQLNWAVYEERTSVNTDRLQMLAYRLRRELKRLGLDPASVLPPRDPLGYALRVPLVELAAVPAAATRPAQVGALPRVWNVPHPRNLNFAGRQDELTQLHAHLALGRPTALVGLGGVGKTQLAVAYAYGHLAAYDLVWWVSAEEPATLAADCALLASALGLPEGSEMDQAVVIRGVQRWLRQQPRWLLIFDNVADPDVVRPFLAQRGSGHVLLTSRHPGWRSLAQPIHVPVLDREAAITLLLRRTGQSDTGAADAVAALVGDLPLALVQAGAYIEARGRSLAEYAQLFQTHRRELLARGAPVDTYPATVATTWALALRRLETLAPAAADLLHLLAFLGPDAIPRHLLEDDQPAVPPRLRAALADPVAFDDTVDVLRRYSLTDVGPRALRVHRLVQAVTRDRLAEADRRAWAAVAVQVVSRAFVPAEAAQAWALCAQLVPHALAAAGHAEALHAETEATTGLLMAAGRYLRVRSHFDAAQPLLERASALAGQALGSNHPTTAQCLNDLAFVLHARGDLPGARRHLERAATINAGVFGPAHAVTAASMNNLGYVVRAQGDLAAARVYFARALRIDQQVYGRDHPDTATSLNNLGMVRRDQGDLPGARRLLEQALAIDERVRGSAHRDTAGDLNNLGTVLYLAGDLDAAATCFERALGIWERTLGPDHLLIATASTNLGVVLQAQGDIRGARTRLERALEIDQRLYGPDHPDVGFDLEHLAALARAEGDLDRARRDDAHAVQIWQARGDQQREKAGLARLGHLAARRGQTSDAVWWVALSMVVAESAGHADLGRDQERLRELCQQLGYAPARQETIVDEARQAYRADPRRAVRQRMAVADGW